MKRREKRELITNHNNKLIATEKRASHETTSHMQLLLKIETNARVCSTFAIVLFPKVIDFKSLSLFRFAKKATLHVTNTNELIKY